MMTMATEEKNATRPYRMSKRQDDIDQTRQRIVEAAVELHGSVGPANTTFSGVASRAGVQRSTVYRHFPDEEALFGACTSHWLARHPWPGPDAWRAETEPRARVERGLRDLYRYYADNEQMLANAFRDIELMPPFVGEFMRAQVEGIRAALSEPWPDADDAELRLALAHAIDFRSWQSLAGNGLRPDDAARKMAAMVACMSGR